MHFCGKKKKNQGPFHVRKEEEHGGIISLPVSSPIICMASWLMGRGQGTWEVSLCFIRNTSVQMASWEHVFYLLRWENRKGTPHALI